MGESTAVAARRTSREFPFCLTTCSPELAEPFVSTLAESEVKRSEGALPGRPQSPRAAMAANRKLTARAAAANLVENQHAAVVGGVSYHVGIGSRE